MKRLVLSIVAIVLPLNVLGSELESMGIQNCPNKCDKVFDRTQYAISDQPGQSTFEFRSCLIGCERCGAQLSSNPPPRQDSCFEFCKEFNYRSRNIRKGVIEPDKACLMGCVINTCQEICVGGTTDQTITPANQHLWWGRGGNGCSQKSGQGWVQNPDYGNPSAPGGQGGDPRQKLCCTSAYNLCFYTGDRNTINFFNVELVARRKCRPFVPSASRPVGSNFTDICNYYNNPQNCGTIGLGGPTPPAITVEDEDTTEAEDGEAP